MEVFYALSLALFLAGCSIAPAPAPVRETPSIGKIIRLDPAFDALVPKHANIEKVATGFTFYGRPGVEARRCPLVQRCAGHRSVTPSGEVKVHFPPRGAVLEHFLLIARSSTCTTIGH